MKTYLIGVSLDDGAEVHDVKVRAKSLEDAYDKAEQAAYRNWPGHDEWDAFCHYDRSKKKWVYKR